MRIITTILESVVVPPVCTAPSSHRVISRIDNLIKYYLFVIAPRLDIDGTQQDIPSFQWSSLESPALQAMTEFISMCVFLIHWLESVNHTNDVTAKKHARTYNH